MEWTGTSWHLGIYLLKMSDRLANHMQTPDLEPLVVYGGYKKLTGILCRISIYFREEAKFDRVPLPQRVSIYSLQGQTAWLILLGEPHYEGNTLK